MGYPSEVRAGVGKTRRGEKPFQEDWKRLVNIEDLTTAASEFVKPTHDLGRFMISLPPAFLPLPRDK